MLNPYRSVLLWLKTVNAIQENSSVVIGNDVGFPGGQQLILQVVYHVTRDVAFARVRTGNVRVLA